MAIENLAKVSPQIDEEMRNNDAQIVFFCEPCRDLMSQAVRDAGYKSFKSFLLMDLRIAYTMRYLLYLRISEMLGEAAQDAPVEKICEDPLLRESLNSKQEAKLNEYCAEAAKLSRVIERIGGFLKNLSVKLMSEGDIDIVHKSFDKIQSALNDERLSIHLRGGEWDD